MTNDSRRALARKPLGGKIFSEQITAPQAESNVDNLWLFFDLTMAHRSTLCSFF